MPGGNMNKALPAIFSIALSWTMLIGSAHAQTQAQTAAAGSLASSPSASSTVQTAPALAPQSAAEVPAPAGIRGQNIFEVKPDASADPKYLEQTNGERMKVQPGNNAPMWRKVGNGVTGYSSLPKSEAPEAGNLIQPTVQYPGSRLTTAGEAWRQVRNNWIIPYGGSLLLIALIALGIFYFAKGPLGHHEMGPNPRR